MLLQCNTEENFSSEVQAFLRLAEPINQASLTTVPKGSIREDVNS